MNTVDVVIPVKNGGAMLFETVSAWLSQQLPDSWRMRLVVVDDGSTDGMPDLLNGRFPGRVSIIRHPVAKGRAGACNAGAYSGAGKYIGFFDADCVPTATDLLARHLAVLESGRQLTFGSIEAGGYGFWSRYLNRVASTREQRFEEGDHAAMTTANCMIERKLFESVGGFDTRYRHYGFEDRDLILRLLQAGASPGLVDKAGVVHDDNIDIAVVAGKMRTAGRWTSAIFRETHPGAYRQMILSRLDVREKARVVRILVSGIAPGLSVVVRLAGWILRLPLPFALKAGTVKICSGLAFTVGTWEFRPTDAEQLAKGESR